MTIQESSAMASTLSTGEKSRNESRSSVVPRHEEYYFPDGTITLLVGGKLYKIYRHLLAVHSVIFASLLSLPQGEGPVEGASDDLPIALDDVPSEEFDVLLSILYPVTIQVPTAVPLGQWKACLDAASRWEAPAVRALALAVLSGPVGAGLTPLERIVLGRRHDINSWLHPAYRDLCLREEPLTVVEVCALAPPDIVAVAAIREKLQAFKKGSNSRASLNRVDSLISERLGLEPAAELGEGAAQAANGPFEAW